MRLAPVAGHLVEDLLGGQQQRVADVFLADEPTAELDADNRGLIVSLLIDRARTVAASS